MSKIAFLGLGAMGSRMAARLLAAGHAVTVWNRSAERTAPLVEQGAQAAATPADAAAGAEVVIAMLRDDSASEAVWCDPETGAAVGMAEGALAIECSTLTVDWTRRLGEVLVDPSVIVRLSDRLDARVAVIGDVAQTGAYPILGEGIRLLDIVTAAGGPTAPADEVDLTLIRNGEQTRLRFDRFLDNPQHNIAAWPGDVLNFEAATRSYTLLGAASVNGIFDFAQPSLSLAEALGQSRGLVSAQAARNGVFLFRMTARTLLEALSPDGQVRFDQSAIPTVYHFDFTEPETLFAAQHFEIQDGDMIYIPDSPVTELAKVLSIFTQGVGAGRNVLIIND